MGPAEPWSARMGPIQTQVPENKLCVAALHNAWRSLHRRITRPKRRPLSPFSQVRLRTFILAPFRPAPRRHGSAQRSRARERCFGTNARFHSDATSCRAPDDLGYKRFVTRSGNSVIVCSMTLARRDVGFETAQMIRAAFCAERARSINTLESRPEAPREPDLALSCSAPRGR